MGPGPADGVGALGAVDGEGVLGAVDGVLGAGFAGAAATHVMVVPAPPVLTTWEKVLPAAHDMVSVSPALPTRVLEAANTAVVHPNRHIPTDIRYLFMT